MKGSEPTSDAFRKTAAIITFSAKLKAQLGFII